MAESADRSSTSDPIAAVIFDCDGTLVDSERLNAQGVADMFADEHGVKLDASAMEQEFRGGKFEDMLHTLAVRHSITLANDFTPRYREYMYELFARELRLMPGVRNAIEAIQARGLPMSVASSGPEKKIHVALEATDIARYFGDLVFSAYTIEIWKPEPDLFLTAAAALNVAPGHCAIIEDSDAGVEAARRAGMRVFGYDPTGAIGHHPEARLTRFIEYDNLPALIDAG